MNLKFVIILALSTSFRGYPLDGKKVVVPKGYTGVILHETIKPTTNREDRKFYTMHKFDSFTYWNWDKEPSKNDVVLQALDWIDVAEVVSILHIFKISF